MQKLPFALLKLILLSCSISAAAADTIYDLVAGFSDTSNPNGVFGYYYGGSGGETLFSYPGQSNGSTCGAALCVWDDGLSVPEDVSIGQNTTGSTADIGGNRYVLNNYLWLDPESYNAEIVFTVPSGGAGTYLISGNFYGNDSNENLHPVDIYDNASNVYGNTIESYQQEDSFSFSENLAVGDTIMFYVGTGSSGCTYCDLNTGLQGTITLETPEPEPWALMAACMGALIFFRRRDTGYSGAILRP